MPAVQAPKNASARKWLPVATITNVTSSGYSAQNTRTARQRHTRASVTPIISANATCIEGTAAYGLKSALTELW